jgi:hypothetical protein
MGYAMIASNVAPRCPGAAEKVPQVARPGSILRHCGTCGTPYVEEKMAHWRTLCLARGSVLPRWRTRGWRLRLAAVRSLAGRRAHQFIVACLAASHVTGIEKTHGPLANPPEQMGLRRNGHLPPGGNIILRSTP